MFHSHDQANTITNSLHLWKTGPFLSAPRKGLFSMLDGIEDYGNKIRKNRFPYKSTSLIVSYNNISAFCLFLCKTVRLCNFRNGNKYKISKKFSRRSWQWRYCHANIASSAYTVCKVEEWKTNLMSLAILFHFLCAQHVWDINIFIIRSLRLCCWFTTLVVLSSVRCVLEFWCGLFWVVFVLQVEA